MGSSGPVRQSKSHTRHKCLPEPLAAPAVYEEADATQVNGCGLCALYTLEAGLTSWARCPTTLCHGSLRTKSPQTKSTALEELAKQREDWNAVVCPCFQNRPPQCVAAVVCPCFPKRVPMPMQANPPKEAQEEREGDCATIAPPVCYADQGQPSPPQSPSCGCRLANCPVAAPEDLNFLGSNPTAHHLPSSQQTSTSYVERSCCQTGV